MTAIEYLREKGLSIGFARLLVAELGGDPEPIEDDWCWEELLKHYAKLMPKAVEWFVAALANEDVGVRWCAARTLGDIGSPAAVTALERVLADRDVNVRWRAAWALDKIGREEMRRAYRWCFLAAGALLALAVVFAILKGLA